MEDVLQPIAEDPEYRALLHPDMRVGISCVWSAGLPKCARFHYRPTAAESTELFHELKVKELA